jgi:PBP1b-binding outer membrane lipoprotein LpoB
MKKLLCLLLLCLFLAGCSGVQLTPAYKYELLHAQSILSAHADGIRAGEYDPNQAADALGLSAGTIERIIKASEGVR